MSNNHKPVASSAKRSLSGRLAGWMRSRKLDVAAMAALLLIGGSVSAINMSGYPQRFEDEGTYVSQAWAIIERGTLTHYTYWYDHPPVGWIQIAGYLAGTNALERYGSAISAGREFMLVIHLATIGLLYAMARRMKIGRLASLVGVLAFALSPLAIEYSRYVLLDNVGLPWLLLALLLALSPRRNLTAAVGSAFAMAIAILSKETFLTLLPVLLYCLWRSGDRRNRRYMLSAFGVVFVLVCGAYVLYATLKNELIPGAGHVSLLGTFAWQLFGREGSGSILDATSGSRGLVSYWLNIDYWLLAAGLATVIPAMIFRNLRPAGFALFIGLALLLRSGYLPYPYVVALLPFAALTFAGVLDRLSFQPLMHRVMPLKRVAAGLLAIAVVIGIGAFVAPIWHGKVTAQLHEDQDLSSRQTVAWIDQNIDRNSRMVVESALWTDLQDKGFDRPDPVWLYKTETDPEVTKNIGGWQGIDYVVLNGPTVGGKGFDQAFPTVGEAIKNGTLVQSFGQDNQKILIYRVNHDRTD